MKSIKTLLSSPDYSWDEAWINGVTAAIMTKKLDTTLDTTKAAIDHLTALGIPNHRVENMVSINKQILAQSTDHLDETINAISKQIGTGPTLLSFLMTNPVILRYGPVDGAPGCFALRRDGKTNAVDETSMAKVVKDAKTDAWHCVYYRRNVILGTSPISMQMID